MSKNKKLSAAKNYAQIEDFSINGLTINMSTPGLHLYAELFLQSAYSLTTPNDTFEPVRPYLVCHAIELGLKAFLSLQGVTMLDLAGGSYGHNLLAILQKADEKMIKQTVTLTDEHFTAIHLASTYYEGKVFEYPALSEALSGYPKMPPIDVLLNAATILVDSLRQPCQGRKAHKM
jgi:hypothetical protein